MLWPLCPQTGVPLLPLPRALRSHLASALLAHWRLAISLSIKRAFGRSRRASVSERRPGRALVRACRVRLRRFVPAILDQRLWVRSPGAAALRALQRHSPLSSAALCCRSFGSKLLSICGLHNPGSNRLLALSGLRRALFYQIPVGSLHNAFCKQVFLSFRCWNQKYLQGWWLIPSVRWGPSSPLRGCLCPFLALFDGAWASCSSTWVPAPQRGGRMLGIPAFPDSGGIAGTESVDSCRGGPVFGWRIRTSFHTGSSSAFPLSMNESALSGRLLDKPVPAILSPSGWPRKLFLIKALLQHFQVLQLFSEPSLAIRLAAISLAAVSFPDSVAWNRAAALCAQSVRQQAGAG